MNLVTVKHTTTYRYACETGFFPHEMMLRPLGGPDCHVLASRLWVSPTATITSGHDIYGNTVEVATFDQRAHQASFVSSFRVLHQPRSPAAIAGQALAWGGISLVGSEACDVERASWCRQADPAGRLEAWARHVTGDSETTLDAMTSMTRRIRDGFVYSSRHALGTQTPLQTLEMATGTCRDFAYLMVEAARSLGHGARFVSGYLYDEDIHSTPDGSGVVLAGDGPDMVGGASTHAWAQVHIAGAGWVDFDPTNNLVGGRNLLASATVMEPHEACPVHGSYDGWRRDYLGMSVDVAVSTRPMHGATMSHAGENMADSVCMDTGLAMGMRPNA